ncbi:MAG: macro domain-containing protein [Desulfatitalea sp.]|nr:macro domain-containing protein [Desulfatitalea sp.]
MIHAADGNLLEANVEALVNTVNCVGIMGKGIALQFKQAFPENFTSYAKACKTGDVRLGRMFVYPTHSLFNPKFIVNFPTKQHWKSKSKLQDVRAGLEALIRVVKKYEIKSIAVPPLGSGLGGLNWPDVKRLILAAFDSLPDVEVHLYEPKGSPQVDKMPISTAKPKMTKGRALLIKLLEIYRNQGYRHSLLEIQKLMYFMQVTGEHLRLNYQKNQFGPYAENLHHVLQHMEGHFIRGYGDRSAQAEIYLLDGAVDEAQSIIDSDEEAKRRLDAVARLIQGFETPYGMELLATVHWVAQESPAAAIDPDLAVQEIQHWSERKKYKMKPQHIKKAWQRLHNENWLNAA